MNTIEDFAKLVEKQQIEVLNKRYPNISNDDCKVNIKFGRKYTKVDIRNSGKYMIDVDGNIFGIKAYGVIHRGKCYGTLDTINDYYWGEYAPVLYPKGFPSYDVMRPSL